MHVGGENFQFASRCESSIKIRQDQALQRLTKPIQTKKLQKRIENGKTWWVKLDYLERLMCGTPPLHQSPGLRSRPQLHSD